MPREGTRADGRFWEGRGASILARGVARGRRFVMGGTQISHGRPRAACGGKANACALQAQRSGEPLLGSRGLAACPARSARRSQTRAQSKGSPRPLTPFPWPSARARAGCPEPPERPPRRPRERHPALLRPRGVRTHSEASPASSAPTREITGVSTVDPSPAGHGGRSGGGILGRGHHHRARRRLLV
jgi:hypothetical protein